MASFWILAALIAAAAQTARNATQASLTRAIGTVGATQVRFLFGLPFAVLFLLAFSGVTGEAVPALTLPALAWTAMGALAQIGAQRAGRRFHHIAPADTASSTMPMQAASSTNWLARPNSWPICTEMPHSIHLPPRP